MIYTVIAFVVPAALAFRYRRKWRQAERARDWAFAQFSVFAREHDTTD